MNNNKNIDFYLEQEYSFVLKKLSLEDGGGWLAEIPDLPGCISDGETQQEALQNIEDAKRSWIEVAIKRGQKIPLPEKELDKEYSGKFTLRMPRSMHKQLAKVAKKEGVSLNQYVLALLSLNFGKVSAPPIISSQKPNLSYRVINIYESGFNEQTEQVKRLWQSPLERNKGIAEIDGGIFAKKNEGIELSIKPFNMGENINE